MSEREPDDAPYCFRCYNAGWLVTCIDDLCRNGGGCMHGDGEEPCPDCNPDGEEDAPWW